MRERLLNVPFVAAKLQNWQAGFMNLMPHVVGWLAPSCCAKCERETCLLRTSFLDASVHFKVCCYDIANRRNCPAERLCQQSLVKDQKVGIAILHNSMADEARDECVRGAMIKGAKAAALALVAAGSAVGVANHMSTNFSNALGVSGKLALVVGCRCFSSCRLHLHA